MDTSTGTRRDLHRERNADTERFYMMMNDADAPELPKMSQATDELEEWDSCKGSNGTLVDTSDSDCYFLDARNEKVWDSIRAFEAWPSYAGRRQWINDNPKYGFALDLLGERGNTYYEEWFSSVTPSEGSLDSEDALEVGIDPTASEDGDISSDESTPRAYGPRGLQQLVENAFSD